MGGARQRPAVVLRQQIRHELLAARQREKLHDRAIAQAHLRQGFELAQHGRGETLEAVGDDEREPAVAGLVAQEDLEDVPQLRGRAFDGAGADLLEQLREQLLARLAARLDPRDAEVLELAQTLPRQRRLADAGRAAQEQRLDVLAEQLLELQQRVTHRMRREDGPRGIGGERIGFELVLFEEQEGQIRIWFL